MLKGLNDAESGCDDVLSRSEDAVLVSMAARLTSYERLLSTDAFEGVDEERFPGSLLPMVLIALMMWVMMISSGLWLVHHIHF